MSAPYDSSPPGSGSKSQPWLSAATEFIDARIALVRSEARDAGQDAAKRLAALLMLAAGVGIGWLLLLVGLIGLIAVSREDWTWYGVTLSAAALHFVVAVIALLVLRRPGPPAFPLTREEFTKDRSWLEHLKKNKH